MRFRSMAYGAVLAASLATAHVTPGYADVDPAIQVGSSSLDIPLELSPSDNAAIPHAILFPEWCSPVAPADLSTAPQVPHMATREPDVPPADEETVVRIVTNGQQSATRKAPAAASARKPITQTAKKSAEKPKVISRQPLSRQQRLTRTALTFRGLPYTWGGESRRRGFDCSGLTQHLYRKEGIALPHSAKLQYKMGKPVQMKDLKHGDLVFFNTTGPLTHVGMYIGDGKFVHAANSRRGITVNSLSDAYYKKRYEGARRYMP